VAHRIVEMEDAAPVLTRLTSPDDIMRVGMGNLRLTTGDIFHPKQNRERDHGELTRTMSTNI